KGTRHMARKTSAARADQPRPSKALTKLRDALGLDEHVWPTYLRHALHGFAEYEQAMWIDPEVKLHLRDVPAEWFEDPDALGYVAVRVLIKGEARLKTAVARHLLQVCAPEPGSFHGPLGIGLAWLHLARQGVDLPVPPASLTYLSLQMPADFFRAVAE